MVVVSKWLWSGEGGVLCRCKEVAGWVDRRWWRRGLGCLWSWWRRWQALD